MQELLELVMLFREEANALGAVYAVLLEPGSKEHQLFDALLKGTVNAESEGIELLYGSAAGAQVNYQAVVRRIKEKLTIGVLLTETGTGESNDREKMRINCQRKWAAAVTLFARKANGAAAELSEQLLKKTIKFEFTDLTISILRRLSHHYALQYGTSKKYTQTQALCQGMQRCWAAENKAEDELNELAAIYAPTAAERRALGDRAAACYAEIAPLLGEFASYRLHFSGRMLEASALMYNGEYAAAAAVCKAAVKFFESKTYHCNVPSQLFNYQLIVCQIQLKQFEEGQLTIRQQQNAFEPGSWNWFKFQELLLLLCMHTGQYQQAYQLQERAIAQKKFGVMPEMIQESWRIYEAYSWFLVKTGHAKAAVASKYKLGKFLNEVPRFSKDKRGTNIPILFARTLHAIADGKFDQLADGTEALAKYASRYLKDDNQLRSNCFIHMLIQVTEGSMHPEAVARKAKKYTDRLAEAPIQIADQPFELEIIPYEMLWDIVLASLRSKK